MPEVDFDPNAARNEAAGKVRVSEEAIARVARKAMDSVDGVAPANPGFIAGLRLGRKTADGVRVSVAYDSETPEIIVDLYVSVRYGLRLPDVCWDLQEMVKEQTEKHTGYVIKAVNVYVHNISFAGKSKKGTGNGEASAGRDEDSFDEVGEDA